MVRRRPGLGPFAALLLVAVAILLAGAPLLGEAQEGTPAAGARPDLAAMPVTPADLEKMGLPGFGRTGNGFFEPFDIFVANEAAYFGSSEGETRAFLRGVGWSRFYGTGMGLASVPGDEESPPLRGVFATILEVADAPGADAYLDFVLASAAASDRQIEATEAPFALGERALLLRDSLDDAEGRLDEIFAVFRIGNLIATSGFWVNVPPESATPAAEPAAGATDPSSPAATVEEVEVLGRRQVERIEAVLAGGAPGLPALLLRVADEPIPTGTAYGEGYRLLDGGSLPFYAGREDDLLADPAAMAGAEAVYELEQLFQLGAEEATGDPYLLNRLYRFPDEAAAAAFMAGRPDALATGGFRLVEGAGPDTGVTLLSGGADLGDESLTFAFVRAFTLNRFTGYEIFVRVGTLVAAVSLEGSPEVPLAQVTDIAAAQAACLEAGACPDALPVPAALRTAADDATPAP